MGPVGRGMLRNIQGSELDNDIHFVRRGGAGISSGIYVIVGDFNFPRLRHKKMTIEKLDISIL